MRNLIAYYRVSSKRQGRSGLGLEAQEAAVDDYARRHGTKVLCAFTEIESGKRADRPELAKAISRAKRANAILCIAKLDRLARNVHFVSGLMESNVEFVACDNPHANKLTLHILSAIAEHESEQISRRTKDALAAAKRRGAKLGAANPRSRNLTDDARRKGNQAAAQAVRERADEGCEALREVLAPLRPVLSFQQIAQVLNLRGERTRRDKPWSDVAVMRACKRLEIG